MKIHEITDPRSALDCILKICNESTQYTRRTQSVHEAAMRGLGMTQPQRERRHLAIFARLGDEVGATNYRGREAYRLECAARAEKDAA